MVNCSVVRTESAHIWPLTHELVFVEPPGDALTEALRIPITHKLVFLEPSRDAILKVLRIASVHGNVPKNPRRIY
jgi:hypothetical protein